MLYTFPYYVIGSHEVVLCIEEIIPLYEFICIQTHSNS